MTTTPDTTELKEMNESDTNGTRPAATGGPNKEESAIVVDAQPGNFNMDDITAMAFNDPPAMMFKVPPPAPPPLPGLPVTEPTSIDTTDGLPQQNDSAAPANTDRKQLKQMTSIEQAKDRAQVTASTAMSIVHVALLKDVLDAGPVGNQYYTWSLGFILTALILQVISGFIALYIALLRYYYTEYKDDFMDDCLKICCPLRLKRVQHTHNTVDGWVKKPITAMINNKKKRSSKPVISAADECDEDDCDTAHDTGCCGAYECTTARYANFEYEILDLYDNMAEEVIKADLKTANSDIDLKWLADKVKLLDTELKKYEMKTDITDEVAHNEQLQSLREQLIDTQRKKDEVAGRNRKARKLRAQGAILQHHVEIIQEERVLKRATFFQNLLNMMLYTVFVLNAVIAGIGLANPQIAANVPAVGQTGALNATAG